MKHATVIILIGILAVLIGGFVVTESSYIQDESDTEPGQLENAEEPIVNSSRKPDPSPDGNMEETLDPGGLR